MITCVKIIAGSVFLLSIYDKSEKETISDKELDILLKLQGYKTKPSAMAGFVIDCHNLSMST